MSDGDWLILGIVTAIILYGAARKFFGVDRE